MTRAVLGIIGGSGLYDLPGLEGAEWRTVESPWGQPSDQLRFGRIGATEIVFLPRHGRGHRLSPSGIDYRANIDALKRSGVTDLISVSAVGSLKQEHFPGQFVLIDQFIDRTVARVSSFFGNGCVAHVSLAHPVAPKLVEQIRLAAEAEAIDHHVGGTYVCMEGPQFSSVAESHLHRSWDASVIGMTNMPEAKLAREAEISYATIAMVTDYDCWHPGHEAVSVEAVIKVLGDNRDNAQRLVARLARDFPTEHQPCPIGSDRALDHAIMTAPQARDPALMARLDAIAGRVLAR